MILKSIAIIALFSGVCRGSFVSEQSLAFGPQTFRVGPRLIGDQNSGIPASESLSVNLSVNFTFNQFSPTSGVLEAVGIHFFGASGSNVSGTHFENLSNTSSAGLNSNVTTTFTVPDAGGSPSTSQSVFSNASTTLNNTSSAGTAFQFALPAQSADSGLYVLPTTSIPAYLGTGTVTLPLTVRFDTQFTTSNGAVAYAIDPTISSTIELYYQYSPLPEPSGALIILGSLAAGVRSRRGQSLVNSSNSSLTGC